MEINEFGDTIMTEIEVVEFINFNNFGDGYQFDFHSGEIHSLFDLEQQEDLAFLLDLQEKNNNREITSASQPDDFFLEQQHRPSPLSSGKILALSTAECTPNTSAVLGVQQ